MAFVIEFVDLRRVPWTELRIASNSSNTLCGQPAPFSLTLIQDSAFVISFMLIHNQSYDVRVHRYSDAERGRPERRATAQSLESISMLSSISRSLRTASRKIHFIYSDDRSLLLFQDKSVDLVLNDLDVVCYTECQMNTNLSGKVAVKTFTVRVE